MNALRVKQNLYNIGVKLDSSCICQKEVLLQAFLSNRAQKDDSSEIKGSCAKKVLKWSSSNVTIT